MNHETDRALDGYLIVLVQGGSRDAFDRLARRWSPRLMRYAMRVLGRPEAAADIVQETWLAAIRGLKRLDDASRFPAWIYSIAHRKCIDGMRFNQRHRRLIDGVTAESIAASEIKKLSTESDEDPDLATAISRLSREHREVVHLFYGEDLGVDDIASVLGVPAGTVKSRLHHARESLKHHLGE